ncbi:hypothetical protein [Faecalicatena orotica]|uniref:hypothetical protein n=1 Tax=Faecalicatena orotica TaxID=1544 RepID=UPI003217E154
MKKRITLIAAAIFIVITGYIVINIGFRDGTDGNQDNLRTGGEYDHLYHSYAQILAKEDTDKTMTVRLNQETGDFSSDELVLDCSKSGLDFPKWEIGDDIIFYYFKPVDQTSNVSVEDMISGQNLQGAVKDG